MSCQAIEGGNWTCLSKRLAKLSRPPREVLCSWHLLSSTMYGQEKASEETELVYINTFFDDFTKGQTK
jgi:hypothetical protein